MAKNERNVLVTGIGVVAPNGGSGKEFYENCVKGVTGIKKSGYFRALGLCTKYAGEVESALSKKEKFYDISRKAALEMLSDSGLAKKDIEDMDARAAFSFSSCNYISFETERELKRCGRDSMKVMFDNEVFYNLADILGIRGETYYSNAACASGTTAAGIAYDLVSGGEADIVIVGGADVFSDVSSGGFHIMENMSALPCKPFDKNRTGLTLGEAACFIMFESERHARERNAGVYAQVVACETRNDAYHVTAPDPSGECAFRCMNDVMKKFPLKKDSIVYVNTHGTATRANDAMELRALERLAGGNGMKGRIYISSTKSMTGHCLGVAGTIELGLCCLCIKNGRMPLSISADDPEDMENIKLVRGEEDSRPFNFCLSSSFAFAGVCACIGIKKYGGVN